MSHGVLLLKGVAFESCRERLYPILYWGVTPYSDLLRGMHVYAIMIQYDGDVFVFFSRRKIMGAD